MGKNKIYIGERFGSLVVVEDKGIKKNANGYPHHIWLCQCDCGNIREAKSEYLNNGRTNNCGCLTSNKLSESSKKHGMVNTRLYRTWKHMKYRCHNPNEPKFYNYGGRGITVCDEWQTFTTFCEWALKNGYSDDLTLDRIDVNGNYEPNNCRWVDYKKQANNTRRNRNITYKGITKTLTEWGEFMGINASTLRYRLLNLNWSVEKALETPVIKTNRKVGVSA